jgi:hypothetical protein
MVEVTREEFDARVGVIEQEVEGEKMVTRHILEQTRRNGDDLAAIKTRLDRVEEKLDGVDLRAVARKVDGLDSNLAGLRRDLPKIVGDVMRDVRREERGKS